MTSLRRTTHFGFLSSNWRLTKQLFKHNHPLTNSFLSLLYFPPSGEPTAFDFIEFMYPLATFCNGVLYFSYYGPSRCSRVNVKRGIKGLQNTINERQAAARRPAGLPAGLPAGRTCSTQYLSAMVKKLASPWCLLSTECAYWELLDLLLFQQPTSLKRGDVLSPWSYLYDLAVAAGWRQSDY